MSPCCRSATSARAWRRWPPERFKERCCFRHSLCARASSDLRPLYDLVGSGIQYPINQITARQSFIKSQRETVKNFMKGFVAGLARFRTDREFGARVLGKNLRETDPKILQETYDFWLKVFPRVPQSRPRRCDGLSGIHADQRAARLA